MQRQDQHKNKTKTKTEKEKKAFGIHGRNDIEQRDLIYSVKDVWNVVGQHFAHPNVICFPVRKRNRNRFI